MSYPIFIALILLKIRKLNYFLAKCCINKNKKIAAIIKVQKIEFKKGNNNGSYVLNIGLTLGNSTVGRYSQYEEWSKVPASFPFYITVDSYE